ncbi:MAG: TfuA-like protein [Acetobacteraceae bacterium]
MRVVIFLGPTLPAQEARDLIAAEILPPARQGDIYRAANADRPDAIGLVDGVFRDAPAVWHREILWALSLGVHVFGAASMGALRAAELAPFGMCGVGKIFEAYRDARWPGLDSRFEDDDEVAVIHAPAEAGSVPLSDAMVDLRATLAAAEMAGVISHGSALALAGAMKRRHFSERSLAALAEAAGGIAGAWMARHPQRIKRQDALAMLNVMTGFLATNPAPFHPQFRFTPALVWQRFTKAVEREARQEMASALFGEFRP